MGVLKNKLYSARNYLYGYGGISALFKPGFPINYFKGVYGLDYYLKKDVEDFLNDLFCCGDDFFYYKVFRLYNKYDVVSCYDYFKTLFNAIIGNRYNQYSFSDFIVNCIGYYNISNYSWLTSDMLDKQISKYYTVYKTYTYDGNSIKDEIGILPRISGNHPYIPENILTSFNINFDDKEERLQCSECYTYVEERENYKKYCKENNYNFEDCSHWLSRYFGDGYGFDVLSFDPVSNHEKLIEVKSKRYTDFLALTVNEYKTMMSTLDLPNTDYYVYEYTFGLDKMIYRNIYKFDKIQRKMINQDGIAFELSPQIFNYFEDGKEKEEIMFFIEDPNRYQMDVVKDRVYKYKYVPKKD